jgi:hypothetical protein
MDSDGRLPAGLTAGRCQRLVELLQKTYDECRVRFDRAVGFDSQTFGQMVYKSSWYHLERGLAEDSGIRAYRAGNGFELDVEGIRLHPFKIGHREGEIHERMPSNEAVLDFMASQNIEQVRLFPREPVTWLVLAHAGNWIDGLRAVYIAAPVRTGSGDYEWASVVRIDDLSDRGAEDVPQAVEIVLPEIKTLPAEREADA